MEYDQIKSKKEPLNTLHYSDILATSPKQGSLQDEAAASPAFTTTAEWLKQAILGDEAGMDREEGCWGRSTVATMESKIGVVEGEKLLTLRKAHNTHSSKCCGADEKKGRAVDH